LIEIEEQTDVTVIIASVSEDDALAQTISSCLMQTGLNMQVVCFIYSELHSVSNPNVSVCKFSNTQVIKIRGKDSGIADAWNASLRFASGKYFIFLGAGDVFFSSLSLSRLLVFAPKIDPMPREVLVGLQFVKSEGAGLRPWSSRGVSDYNLSVGMTIPHASSLWPSWLWVNNKFDPKFKIALDYEFALRVSKEVVFRGFDLPVSIVESGGISNSPKNLLRVILEDALARKRNDRGAGYITYINFKRIIRWLIRL